MYVCMYTGAYNYMFMYWVSLCLCTCIPTSPMCVWINIFMVYEYRNSLLSLPPSARKE